LKVHFQALLVDQETIQGASAMRFDVPNVDPLELKVLFFVQEQRDDPVTMH
jgi:hypothetical protein